MTKASESTIYVFRLPKAVYNDLTRTALETGVSRADIVRMALNTYLSTVRGPANV